MARSVGAALSGNDDEDQPLKNIVTSSASNLYDRTLGDPASRAALLQIGLNLMQPTAIGQTTGGAIGQAIGSGGEEVTRAEETEAKRRKEEEDSDIKGRTLDIRQQEANAYGKALSLKKLTDRMALQKDQQTFKDEQAKAASENDEASQIFKEMPKVGLLNPEDPVYKKFGGKTPSEIKRILKQDAAAGAATPVVAPATAPATAAVKPAAAAVDTLPPPASRVAGKTMYKGHVWNGSGWDPIASTPFNNATPMP